MQKGRDIETGNAGRSLAGGDTVYINCVVDFVLMSAWYFRLDFERKTKSKQPVQIVMEQLAQALFNFIPQS